MSVTVYSKPDCMQCMYTKKWLNEHNIKFKVIDVTQDSLALDYIKQDLGYQAVPVVVADDEHWYGFRPDKLTQLKE